MSGYVDGVWPIESHKEGSIKKRKVKMARVNAADFVDAWVSTFENGGGQAEVARILGCSSANVSTRAKKLREAGVELPFLTVTRGVKATIDVAALNERLKARMA